jgi:endonuclease-3
LEPLCESRQGPAQEVRRNRPVTQHMNSNGRLVPWYWEGFGLSSPQMLGVTIAPNPTHRRITRRTTSPGSSYGICPETVASVITCLKQRYGLPRHGNPRRPLDDLFYIILSNKTTPGSARRVYRALRHAYPSWEGITTHDFKRLKALLEPAGLANVRASQIVGIVTCLRERFGSATLAPLRTWPRSDVETFLAELPGVSLKVAKCVMMYTLGFRVLPVDTHVHRISRRLGWISRKRADQCHEDLEAIVAPSLRYAFHVGCLAHGRTVCRPNLPHCDSCVIRRFCSYYHAQARQL